MNTSISISVPPTGLAIDFVDQRDILLVNSVPTKPNISPYHDQVGQGGAALHPPQGVGGVGL